MDIAGDIVHDAKASQASVATAANANMIVPMYHKVLFKYVSIDTYIY